MHGSLADNAKLLAMLRIGSGGPTGAVSGAVATNASGVTATQIGICVPFPYLAQTAEVLTGSSVSWGAQDLSVYTHGAYTGETSGAMLADFSCRWVLVGHSERRAMHAESDQLVADKARAALGAGITPVVCVGESLAERDAGQVFAVITRQMAPVLALGTALVQKMVVAYEPVWAIGTGRTATPEQAQEVHAAIRAALEQVGAGQVQILYGGSVKASNAASLFAMPDIDGALVGGASLVAEDFLTIAA